MYKAEVPSITHPAINRMTLTIKRKITTLPPAKLSSISPIAAAIPSMVITHAKKFAIPTMNMTTAV